MIIKPTTTKNGKATLKQYLKMVLKWASLVAFIKPSKEINTVIKVVEKLQKAEETLNKKPVNKVLSEKFK